MIDESERDDFFARLRELGFDPADFEVMTGRRMGDTTGEIYALNETVAVRRKSTDVLEEYRSGNREAWSAKAIEDVIEGKFGVP